jgi:D-aspartate ligase
LLNSSASWFIVLVTNLVKDPSIIVGNEKRWCAGNRMELRHLYQRATELASPGEILIQDLIPGDRRNQFGYYAFSKDGQAAGSLVARRRHQHPREFGRASTFVEMIDLPTLEALSERFLRAINF